MQKIDTAASIIILIGALNWGLIGVLETDAFVPIFGENSWIPNFLYSVIGFSALYLIIGWVRKFASK